MATENSDAPGKAKEKRRGLPQAHYVDKLVYGAQGFGGTGLESLSLVSCQVLVNVCFLFLSSTTIFSPLFPLPSPNHCTTTNSRRIQRKVKAMPHAEMKSARRAKRELQQRTPLGGRRISSALTARSSSNTPNIPESESLSISAPIPKAPIPIITQTAPPTPPKGWRNPADLPFIAKAGKTWDDLAIIRFLRTKAAFSIPPRAASTADPWLLVRCPGAGVDGELVRLPRGYRIPLLWVAKFLWSSVELILSPADPAVRKDEWDDAKFDILHAARLCEYLLSAAAEAGAGMDRGWRCAAFDRALRRYWHRWLVSRDEFVRDFWREFGEEEYEGDVLKLGWGQWVLKGHKGFALMKQEVLNGIGVEEFTKGLVVDEDEGTFQWLPSTTESPTTEHHSHGSSTPSTVNSMPPVQVSYDLHPEPFVSLTGNT
ncbi:hypothetical protein B0H16DRAFT_724724 [Mycena metata]|uniref:Uncharacterized protein n=1 Tax=Mycena metata TaxID=1033252 RepID=A0AAD7K7C5_9AGAR|nr:hypothetical protein B0H16DRAFT_724724 [Mycena metata]